MKYIQWALILALILANVALFSALSSATQSRDRVASELSAEKLARYRDGFEASKRFGELEAQLQEERVSSDARLQRYIDAVKKRDDAVAAAAARRY